MPERIARFRAQARKLRQLLCIGPLDALSVQLMKETADDLEQEASKIQMEVEQKQIAASAKIE